MSDTTIQKIADFISCGYPCMAISLSPNWKGPCSRLKMIKALDLFLTDYDQGLFGKKFYRRKRPPEPGRPCVRVWGAFCIEKLGTNPHLHGLIQAPPPQVLGRMLTKNESIEDYIESRWRGRVASGTVCVKRATDPEGWLEYMTKESATALSEEMVWTFEFWPSQQS